MSARILVLRTGQAVNRVHAHCGPFYRMFQRTLNAGQPESAHASVDEMDITVREAGDPMPPLDRYDGAIMTGSPAFVEDGERWMFYGQALLEHILKTEVPLLAVCFGYQLLGKMLGSDVGKNRRGREMGTVEVSLQGVEDDPLFSALPARFLAQCTHRDVIRNASGRLRVLGNAPHDQCHVVRAGPVAWGVQFHPEFDDVVMRLYLEARRDVLDTELGAGAYEERIHAVKETPEAASLLPRFAALCAARAGGSRG